MGDSRLVAAWPAFNAAAVRLARALLAAEPSAIGTGEGAGGVKTGRRARSLSPDTIFPSNLLYAARTLYVFTVVVVLHHASPRAA